ncbi:MAG TPA: ATP-binding cassette domain-containing protein, partial [Novosphingobium sp.]|nr:ATP-binding cassette domain-containing protein [Novosphingobium sp.]
VRTQLGGFGFSADKAQTKVGQLSGGERARLMLALATLDKPNLLILDEPTNHLDVDAREALVQALNAYEGAVILISHDRHMVELTADRLVLVDGGAAEPYDGSMEDYIDFVLGRNQPKPEASAKPAAAAAAPKANQLAWAEQKELQKKLAKAEKDMARLQGRIAEVDLALAEPAKAPPALKGLALGKLSQMRDGLEAELADVEAQWLAWGETLEG